MRLCVLLLVACTVIRTNAITDSDLNLIETLFPAIRQYLQISGFQKYLANVTIVKQTQTPVLNYTFLEGVLSYTDLYLIGLNGMNTSGDFITLDIDRNEQLITLGLNLSVSNEIGLKMEQYDMDIALIQTVPLYGTGGFKFTFYSLELKLEVSISYQDNTDLLHDLLIVPTLSRATFEFDGFWRNPELSKLLSEILTGFIDLFVIVWDLELDCFSCILSKILQDVGTQLINKADKLSLNDTFIKESCTSICLPSETTLVQTLLLSTPEQLMDYVSADNLLRYADIAAEYLNEELERLNL